MKLSSVLVQLLRKHKLIGTPVKKIEIEEETKESVYKEISKIKFFEEIEEYEKRGILLAYDELIEYRTEIEVEEIEKQLKLLLREYLHSFYLSKHNDKYYLYIRYTEEPDNILIGPIKSPEKKMKEEEEAFKSIWKERVEYRKFLDGKIRICASFKESKIGAKYEILRKLFKIETVEEKGEARILSLAIPTTAVENSYEENNRRKSSDLIDRALETVKTGFPVTILQWTYTGAYNRMTRGAVENRTQIYLKVGRGHIWPKDNRELSDGSVTALNGVLSKSLEKTARIKGLSKDNTVYASAYGEEIEFIFDVEGEQKMHREKYELMDARIAYEIFFRDITQKNKTFPKICSVVKDLLFSHGIYPNYITDKSVEILCYRTGYTANTLSGGLKGVLSTQYTRGYTIDIRKGKYKIRPKDTGKIEIVHKTGIFSIKLPEKEIFNRMNRIFNHALRIIENNPGLSVETGVSEVYRELFKPTIEGIWFSLSRVPVKGYTEIVHYSKEIGGTGEAENKEILSSLIRLGCKPYFCRSGIVHVEIEKEENSKIAIGAAILLTGMKYIKIRKE